MIVCVTSAGQATHSLRAARVKRLELPKSVEIKRTKRGSACRYDLSCYVFEYLLRTAISRYRSNNRNVS